MNKKLVMLTAALVLGAAGLVYAQDAMNADTTSNTEMTNSDQGNMMEGNAATTNEAAPAQ